MDDAAVAIGNGNLQRTEGMSRQIPLCVDLDGTLVKTDMLHEITLLLMKQSPKHLAMIPMWLRQGKANLKSMIAERVQISSDSLPYCESVFDLIRQARADGRRVVLATASPRAVAEAIADHLGLFDAVIASDRLVNLSAVRKAEKLVEMFGDRGFDYIGNSRDDLPVIRHARTAYMVTASSRLKKDSRNANGEVLFIETDGFKIKPWIKALRVHQWVKNLLVFVPILAAHKFFDLGSLLQAIAAFFSFSLCASSVYILNDLLDLTSDRSHKRKRNRPFASGRLPIASGIVMAPALLLLSFSISLALPHQYIMVLLTYYLMTNAYSFFLKRQVIVDVCLLAALYTVRILAGAAATLIRPSFWLLALSMFIFLSLAILKRYSELRLAVDGGSKLAGRGYRVDDLPVVMSLGTSSGMVGVLILAMYTQASVVSSMYPAAEWLWALPVIMLYWITRIWSKAQRGEVDDDPVLFAAKDWQSLVAGACMAFALLMGALGFRFW